MKKTYFSPEMDLILLNTENVLSASTGIPNGMGTTPLDVDIDFSW